MTNLEQTVKFDRVLLKVCLCIFSYCSIYFKFVFDRGPAVRTIVIALLDLIEARLVIWM